METNTEMTILDEIQGFVSRHVNLASESKAVAMTLYAAATHATEAFPAFGRMLFTSDKPESGKTTAMEVTAALCSNPQSAEGTSDGLVSTLAEATTQPEVGVPTLLWDEVEKFWGLSGLNKPAHIFQDVATKGYKRGKTRSRSVNRAKSRFSIYTPILMTGLQTAVPTDLRTRCIIIWCEPGEPKEYFDVRESEPLAYRYGRDLRAAVRNVMGDLAEFRALGMHPKLIKRKLEVWEPLFAVALHLGGQRWLNKCMDAFTELAADSSSQLVLTIRQQLIRDAVELMDGPLREQATWGFIPGEALALELKGLDTDPYDVLGVNAILQLVARNMEPAIRKRRVGGLLKKGYELDQMVGYFAGDIRAEWDKIRPDERKDVEIPEFANPFDISSDDDGDLEYLPEPEAEVAGVAGVSGYDPSKDEPEDSVLTPPCEQDDEPVVITSRRRKPKVQTAAGQFDDKYTFAKLKEK